jgi:hypothetical protein
MRATNGVASMNETATSTLAALPYSLPACPNARTALFAMRRMGAHGLSDARAAHAMMTAFGGGFRRPLTLMRGLMADLAAHSSVPIAIAPCCCARMTPGERALLTVLARVEVQSDTAALLLSDLIGQRRCDGVLASAAAVAMAFADEGRPVCV